MAGLRLSVEVDSPFPAELAKIKSLAASGSLDAIIRRYPARESPILTELAKGLRFQDRGDYERAALARIAASHELRQAMREALGEVSALLAP